MKCFFEFILVVSLLVISTSVWAQVARKAFDPTSSYEQKTVHGHLIYVNRKLMAHPTEAAEALSLLENQLKGVEARVPSPCYKALKKIAFWMEWEADPKGAAVYHPSEDWLIENGYNPAKARCIEISNARNFVKWVHQNQPFMILHELAHAYHHNVLGFDNPLVEATYKAAKKAGMYGVVPYFDGKRRATREAYAATNPQEYFAEISEAYFGENDFYPFNASELQRYDPTGYALLEAVWGQPHRLKEEKVGQ